MKAIIVILFTMLSFTLSSQIKVDNKGNYVQETTVSGKRDTVNTGKTFTDSKGIVYPVFKSSTGKLYVGKVSKSGNYYRYYLKIEAQ